MYAADTAAWRSWNNAGEDPLCPKQLIVSYSAFDREYSRNPIGTHFNSECIEVGVHHWRYAVECGKLSDSAHDLRASSSLARRVKVCSSVHESAALSQLECS